MARSSHDGATPWLALIVGGLIVIVALIAFAMRGREATTDVPRNVDINLSLPKPSLPETPKLPQTPIPTPK